jgi:two-component system chemotaxis response regulator CheY
MYYTIGEISSMVNISKDTLRYYDEVGILKPCKIDAENRYRYYGPEQISMIAKILEYKDYGFTLEQIKGLLVCNDTDYLRDALKKQYENLVDQKDRLEVLLSILKRKLEVNVMDKKKLLIVDDAEFMRTVLTGVLNNRGTYEPISAVSGEEALELYSREKPDLVLMDIAMPGGMDGIECTAKIRELDPLATIIMLSARDSDENKAAAKKAGACGFISKPFSADNLIEFISKRETRFFSATNFSEMD